MGKKRILVAGLLALAWATPSVAFDIKWSGDLENRFMYSTQADLARYSALSGEGGILNTWYVNNATTALGGGADTRKNRDDSDFFGEIKYKLTLSAADFAGAAKGVVGFEFGGLKFGQRNGSPVTGAGSMKALDFAGDDNVFELRFAYTDFAVPFDPASRLFVGLQPVGYNKFLWNDTAAGVKYVSKRGKIGYSLGWFRNDVANANSGTGGAAKNAYDDFFGADLTYSFNPTTRVNVFAHYMDRGDQPSFTGSVAPISGDDRLYWLGASGDGNVGNLFYGATAMYLGGEINADGAATDLDRKAYLLNAEATYKLGKTRIRGGWLYASGDDDATDGDAENFANIDAYMGYFGSAVILDSQGNDNTLLTTPYVQDKGLNMPYVTVDYAVNDKTSVGASYIWFMTAEDIKGAAGRSGDTDLGHEFSVRGSYEIAKGMTATLQAGYFFGGDAWDELATGFDSDDVFRSDLNLRYQF